MKRQTKNILLFAIFIILLAGWILIFKYVNPQSIVAKLGATNGYTVLFLLGTIGGASTFAGPSYFLALATLAIGGLNPVLLGISGGLGVAIGDALIFSIGLKAGKKAPEKFKEKISKFEKYIETKRGWLVNLLLYIYIGFSPFPNEIATIPLGLVGYGKKKIILFLLLGDITSGILGAFLAVYGIKLFT
ncbi:MAG: hypothetical protein Q8Q04_02490 [archaeon]|nr:hypothetical protein [archaeon]